MSDFIDKKDIEFTVPFCGFYNKSDDYEEGYIDGIDRCEDIIHKIPPVEDVQRIIKCKNCKYWADCGTDGNGNWIGLCFCDKWYLNGWQEKRVETKSYGFCMFAERK